MPRIRLIVALAVAASVVSAAPAHAARVIVVDGSHARRVNDPDVPSKASVRLPPAATGAAIARSSSRTRADRRAVYSALSRAQRSRGIAPSSYRRWRVWYVRALRTYRHLRGARRQQLGYVIDSVEALALARRLTPTRMPGVFVQLERNRRYWRALPYPAAGDQVSFKGSELLYQYYPGRGLQLQVLSTFKKANNMHGDCERGEPTCDRAGLQRLLDEMAGLAVQRTRRWIAWEYGFYFDGGYPPWISGMAEATGIQAYARAAQLLGKPEYVTLARRALGAFQTSPPTGVRTRGFLGGVHYLQYSFAPRTYIFNAFTQSLIGLWDFSRLTGNKLAMDLYRQAEPELRREIPYSDVGDWTLYSYRGPEANHDYHELLREVLDSMCIRRLGDVYCTYAERYRGYQVDPPVLTYTGPDTATARQLTYLRFTVSKLSAVEVKVYRGRRVVFSRLATFRRGSGAFAWRPGAPGTVTVKLAAKELRTGLGKKDRTSAEIQIEPAS